MGKDSLIKSTSKKKTKSANEEETKKKTVKKAATKPKKAAEPKTAKKSPAKTTAKKTKSAAAKPKAKATVAKPKAKTAAAKSSAKKSAVPAKPKAKPKAAAKKTKKTTIPALLAKKFDSLPGAPKPKPAAPEKKIIEASPPVISTSDPAEAARIRALLMAKFSMAEVKAAAKSPEPEKSEAAAKTPEPQKTEAAAPEAPAPEPEAPEGETPAAPADEPPVITTTVVQEDAPEPIPRAIKYGIAAMALLVLILLGISNNNSSKYYIHPKEGGLEIWKGRFSPKDNRFFMVLHGVQLDQEVKAVYSRSDVYPMIFDYYLEKADTLLEVPGLPDFEGIKGYLYQARSYAITPETKNKVKGRLNSIERMILLYKADVAVSKNSEDSLKAALKDLQKASGLVANPTQQQEIDQKIELVKKLQNELKSKPK
jgi:hypothetical protein